MTRVRFQQEKEATTWCCDGQEEDSGTDMTIRALITVWRSEVSKRTLTHTAEDQPQMCQKSIEARGLDYFLSQVCGTGAGQSIEETSFGSTNIS